MKNFLLLLLAIICLSLSSGCAITNQFGPYYGKIVDAETKEPIEGAVVLMECFTELPTVAGAVSSPEDVKAELTDSKGEFNIELRCSTFKLGHVWNYDPLFTIFKPGYGAFPFGSNSHVDITTKDSSYIFPKNTYVTVSMEKLKSKKEIIRNLGHLRSCHEQPCDKWQLLIDAINIERKNVGLDEYRKK